MSHEEPHIVGALVDLCVSLGVTCVVQVGAEDGYEADRIREATGCRAVVLEPDPTCAPVSHGVEFHEVLAGATNCISDFYLHQERGLSSQISREDGKEMRTEMPQMRLDTFCGKHGIVPDALIIDTEGTTLDVLEGAGFLLDRVRLIYAEAQSVAMRPGMRLVSEVDAFLSVRGFTAHDGLPSYTAGLQGNYTWVRK